MRLTDGSLAAAVADTARDAQKESALLRRVAEGDRAAFVALYERYQRPLFRYLARMIRQEARAEELVNEVLIDVWRSAKNYRGQSQPSTWIFGIAHHKAVDELRKRYEEPVEPEELAAAQDPAPGPPEVAEASELAQVLKRLLDCLSPQHREVLELTYYQGFSVQEVAAVIGCPVNTVKTRMFYARRRLEELLAASGVRGGEIS